MQGTRSGTARTPPRLACLAVVVGVGSLYAAGSLAAFAFFMVEGAGATFFPSAGLSVAALVLLGPRFRVAVVVGIATAELTVDLAQGLGVAALGYTVANTVQPLVALALLGRRRDTLDLDRRDNLARFVAAAVLVAPLLGGVLGATTDTVLAGGDRWLAFVGRWWLGDGLGVLVVGTALLAARSPGTGPRTARRAAEAAVLLALTVGTVVAAVWGRQLELVSAVVLLLVWAAFRFGLLGVAVSGAIVAFLTAGAVAGEAGPWAQLGLTPAAGLLYVQLLLAAMILTMAALATEIRARERTLLRFTEAETARVAAEATVAAERETHRRVELLARVATALSGAATTGEVVRALHSSGFAPLGAAATAVGMTGPAGLVRTVTAPRPDEPAAALVAPPDPPGGSPDYRVGRAAAGAGYGAAVVLPLRDVAAPLGALAVAFAAERGFDPADRALLEAVAAQAGAALERARLYELAVDLREDAERRAARERLRSEVSARLNGAGDSAGRMRALVEVLVPAVADFATLEVPTERGGHRVAAAAHPDPAALDALLRLRREHPGVGGVPQYVARALATGEPQLVADVDAGTVAAGAAHPRARGLVATLAPRSFLVVPLSARGGVAGVLLLCQAGSGRRFRADDVAFLTELVAEAALAIENARLHEAEHRIAEVLQHSLLPQRLPDLPGLALGARYVSGAEGTQAGGDWYDVIVLGPQRAAVVVGDVVGMGPSAAAVMGQLRSALASALLDGRGPAAALEHLDRFAARVPGALASTAACLLVDLTDRTLRWSRAGHPPPVLVGGGGCRLLAEAGGTVLGVRGRPPYAEATVRVEPGATVLLYTDGLVERRGEPVDQGIDRLVRVAGTLSAAAPDDLLDGVLGALTPSPAQADDVAIVAARVLPPALRGRLPAEPAALTALRRTVRGWAAAAALDGDLLDDLQLALGEAAGNAVEHAYRGDGGGDFAYALEWVAGGIAVEVRDAGAWRPPPADRGHRGRGLAMIRALAGEVTVQPGPAGTTVRFRVPPAVPS